MKTQVHLLATLLLSISLALPVHAAEPTLDTVKRTGTLKLGYRENSPPFSFLSSDGKPSGYSIELCQKVAKDIATELKLQSLETKWIPVSASSRFEALKSGGIDLECGNTTQTLSRRADFDFSIMTFVDGAGLLYLAGNQAITTKDMSGQRIVVVAGTTTETVLSDMISAFKLGAQLVRVEDHDAALATLKSKMASAYAADRTVLVSTVIKHGNRKDFELSNVQFSYEPYGLMMRRDADLRLMVDRTLARLYRTGEIVSILRTWFAPVGNLTDAIDAMTQLNSIPE